MKGAGDHTADAERRRREKLSTSNHGTKVVKYHRIRRILQAIWTPWRCERIRVRVRTAGSEPGLPH